MDLQELEENPKAAMLPEDDGEFEKDDEQEEPDMLVDLNDAMVLLSRCMHLLDYVSDTELCKTITKRERETFGRLSDSIREYLDDVEAQYTEE